MIDENEDLGNLDDEEIVIDELPQGDKTLEVDQRTDGRTQHVPDQALKIATIGSMPFVNVLPHLIQGRNFVFRNFDDIDTLVDWQPSLTFVCDELPMKVNGLQDDVEFIATIQKLEAQTTGGICIKSVISPDTMGRVIMSLEQQTVANRFIYNPEMVDSGDLEAILNNADKHLVSGTPEAIAAHMQFFNMTSLYTFNGVVQCGLMEGAILKMSASAYKAVKQTFFNQLKDVADEYQVSPSVIRKSVENLKDNLAESVPTLIRAQMDDLPHRKAKSFSGEYDNYDVSVFVGMTDKMPLLDECVNYRNLKKES